MRFNPLRGRRPSPAMIVAVVALIAALAGTATAAGLITSAKIKNGTIRGKDIHKRTISAGKMTKGALATLKGNRGPAGPKGATGAKGAPGSAVGFATITSTGAVIASRSSANVKNANVSKSGNLFCFNNLPFTPKAAIGNIDSNFAVGYTLQTNTQNTAGACPGAEQASAVEVDSTGAFKSPVTFNIAFY
jgi:hypothetical protein